MHKRLLVGLAGAGIVGGATFGFAATLGVNSDNLGAGGDAVGSCDLAIDATYTAAYTATGYKVTNVVLSGIAPLCDGESFQITLSDVANASITELTGVIAQASGSQTVPVTADVPAAAVEGIDVVVSGDNA